MWCRSLHVFLSAPFPGLIAEVILYSEGFEDSKNLAKKMTQMYTLCSEQLSQQDHYDFGMRAVKSVLVMAGSLKRQNPDKSEDVVLIRALRDSNLPKFLKDDAVLFQVNISSCNYLWFSDYNELTQWYISPHHIFCHEFLFCSSIQAILQDLFPGVEIPEHDYGRVQSEIESVILSHGLQVERPQVKKVIQLYETMLVRHGVMLVGPTGSGKTAIYKVLFIMILRPGMGVQIWKKLIMEADFWYFTWWKASRK